MKFKLHILSKQVDYQQQHQLLLLVLDDAFSPPQNGGSNGASDGTMSQTPSSEDLPVFTDADQVSAYLKQVNG